MMTSDSLMRKIVPPEALDGRLKAARAAGRTIVHCHGCFDIVHPGHVRYLLFARQLGDLLVVSLTADAGVSKGPDRPYIPQELRAENLAALEFVDLVVIDTHPTAAELLEIARPSVYVKGREYAGGDDPRFAREREIVERHGGRVVFHSGDVVFSSTRLIESLERDAQLDHERLAALCRRQGIDLRVVRAALEGFTDRPALVVGDSWLERTVECAAPAIAGDEPVMELQRSGLSQQWGGAAALACALRSLGARVRLVTATGADDHSRRLLDELCAIGIDVQPLECRKTLAVRETFRAGERSLWRLTDGAAMPLDSVWERHALRAVREGLSESGLLAWLEGGHGVTCPALVRDLAGEARGRGMISIGLAAARGDLTTLSHCDVLLADERQVRDAQRDGGSGLPAVTWRMLARQSSRSAIIQLAQRGWLAFDGGPRESAGTPERLKCEFVPTLAPGTIDDSIVTSAVTGLALAGGASLWLAAYLGAAARLMGSRTSDRRADVLDSLLARRPELRGESRFLPDSWTASDITRIAPPLPIPSAI